ncbi:MAG: NADH-quinone oxidoreductase subunit L [Polyangiaceae bacterium]
MKELLSLFSPQEFTPLGLILLMPLLGAFVNGVWGKRLGKDAVRLMALASVGASFLIALVTVAALDTQVGLTQSEVTEHGVTVVHQEHVKLFWTAWEWLYTSGKGDGQVPISLKFSVDALSGVMMLVITGVGFLIHLYASSYMEKDKAYWRFFAYLNLFVFSMLILVLGDNMAVLFVGWEGVGLCSYLLIGFWYPKMENAAAGKKAFIANRIGDFGLICAMFLLVHYTGALDWKGIESGSLSLLTPSEQNQVHVWPISGGHFTGVMKFLQPEHPITMTAATAISLCLLLGATGKSAQLPLYVWLPDAMAGPTPVSALIHAATMVTAGIYLVCRLSFVFVLAPGVMMTIAIVGAATAFLAATIALVQNDIKKVLAYSTVSQLGFMFLGVGMGAFTAGFFHVFTHAFFKACLFLGAGSVIHAMHARIHDDEKSQDMRNMGGLRKYMPYTFWTFAVSTAAIIGFPLTSGFFSKDEILYKAMSNRLVLSELAKKYQDKGAKFYVPPEWIGPALYWVGLAAATMTAFYMCRLLFLTFFGEFRGWKIGRPSMASVPDPADVTAHATPDALAGAHDDDEDNHHHHEEDLTAPGRAPHESPWQMTVPLIILATFAAFAGLLLNPVLLKHVLHLHALPMDHWLEPVFEAATKHGMGIAVRPDAEKLEWLCTGGAFAAFASGSGLAYWVYIVQKGAPARSWAEAVPKLHKLLLDKWRVDELYDYTALSGVDALADTFEWTDRSIVDGIIAKLTSLLTALFGTILRAFQSGVVHVYAGAMVLGLGAVGYFLVAPHAEVQVVDKGEGNYDVIAAPGFGYGYKWLDDPGKEPEKSVFTGSDHAPAIKLEPGQSKTIELRVQNAFGMVAKKPVTISRPKPAAEALEQLGQN